MIVEPLAGRPSATGTRSSVSPAANAWMGREQREGHARELDKVYPDFTVQASRASSTYTNCPRPGQHGP